MVFDDYVLLQIMIDRIDIIFVLTASYYNLSELQGVYFFILCPMEKVKEFL